ncbi:MAG: hypothetical protein CNLJKLNK_00976 [Holosporales bacterium]
MFEFMNLEWHIKKEMDRGSCPKKTKRAHFPQSALQFF